MRSVGMARPRHRVIGTVLPCILAVGGVGTGCDDEEVVVPEELLRAERVMDVYVVQDPDDPGLDALSGADTREIMNATGSDRVAVVMVEPIVVPIEWGDPDADPSTDFMTVTLSVESDFVDLIKQVDLMIEAGDGSSEGWCEPMIPDGVVDGQYFLRLQPACADRDPLTGACDLSASTCTVIDGEEAQEIDIASCRQDRLTFVFWDASSSECNATDEEG